MEFYALVQTLKHWHPYLIHREFILYINHDSLKHLNSQNKLNARHARWMDYLHQFEFVIRHKLGTKNKMADTLSRRPHLLFVPLVNVMGFNNLKLQYVADEDFGSTWSKLTDGEDAPISEYSLKDVYVFYGTQLFIPHRSFCEFVISELHGGGLSGHFGYDKTFAIVANRFFFLPRLC